MLIYCQIKAVPQRWCFYSSWVFLFLARVRFPRNESIPSVIRRYGHDTLKILRNFEKLDYKIRKAELHMFLKKVGIERCCS